MDEVMKALMSIDDTTLLEMDLDDVGYDLAAIIEKKDA